MAEGFLALHLLHRSRTSARNYRVHSEAFRLRDDAFIAKYRLSKDVALWLCDEISEDLRPRRQTVTTLSVEQQVLCALRFYASGGFQRSVANDEDLAIEQATVSRVLHPVTTAIVEILGPQWIKFPQTAAEKSAVKADFATLGRINGVVGEYNVSAKLYICVTVHVVRIYRKVLSKDVDEINLYARTCSRGLGMAA